MRTQDLRYFCLAFVLIAILISCVGVSQILFRSRLLLNRTATVVPTLPDWACMPVATTFQREDLVGTWVEDFSGGTGTDTLQLFADGTFVQSYVDSSADYEYEGSLNTWELEARTSGGYYLHLKGMKFCAFEDKCQDPSEKNTDGGFYDYCERKFIEMEGELILAVVSPDLRLYSRAPSRGIVLKYFRPSGWEAFYYEYTLVNQSD